MSFYWLNVLGGLAYGALLFMIASGFTLIFGLMRVVNVAHTALYLLGVYLGLTMLLNKVNFWLAALVSGIAIMIVGLVIYRGFLHRYRTQELTTVLLSLGFSIILADVVLAIWGGDPRSVPPPPELAHSVQLFGVVFPAYWLAMIGLAAVVAILLGLLVRYTLLGAIIRAGVDDQEMLRALGVDVDKTFYLVFALGSFLAGLGGVLGGPITAAYPGLDAELLPLAFAVVIVGGMGSLAGAYLGSIIVGLVNAFGKALFPQLSYFTIFVPVAIIMAVRPRGLLGRR
ncbi:branched-chain amino acid ABC transporter permease [Thermaerobacter composti]|uniref:Branched-chain amino acid ABC transporter permease n=1 Tax=Thermaerobacter composti TaxID=554949 RepID=A0ABZ0QPV2_9FIRM|nr:branched-chain amino acid ABC transporter permease [Thermaerobacter composti]WPD18532.1 branched-chain amino acid ABC transporter permease [Thermaerobacter composti]